MTSKKIDELIIMVKFASIGLVTATIESASYYVFFGRLSMSHPLSQALSYTLGSIIFYAINRRFTFKSTEKFLSKELLKYAVVSFSSLLFGIVLMMVLAGPLGLSGTPIREILAKITTMFLTTISNYLGQRLWAFGKEGGTK